MKEEEKMEQVEEMEMKKKRRGRRRRVGRDVYTFSSTEEEKKMGDWADRELTLYFPGKVKGVVINES